MPLPEKSGSKSSLRQCVMAWPQVAEVSVAGVRVKRCPSCHEYIETGPVRDPSCSLYPTKLNHRDMAIGIGYPFSL